MPPVGKIFFASRASKVFLRLEGRATHALGADLDQVITRLCARGDFTEIVIDLTAATALDSTMLGLVAKVAKWMHLHRQRAPTLLAASDKIAATVRGVGLDRLVNIVTQQVDAPGDLHEAPTADVSRDERARTILAAHQELMSLNARNASEFKSVVEFFEQELRDKS
jgi:anti-anti-sigma regulatory factor